MMIYNETRFLYLETGTSNSILRLIAFGSKSLSNVEKRYSNIGREALGILHGLEKFHHHCFAKEGSIILDHKSLVAVFKKAIATILQLQLVYLYSAL